MKIGFDLDEVLADQLPAVIEFHNSVYGTSLTREQFRSLRYWETWGGTKEEAIQKVYDYYRTPYFRNIKPVAGSQEAVNTLKQSHDLCIITARPNDFAQETIEWVDCHFPCTFSEIHFANHYALSGLPKTKAEICDSSGVDILVEDSLEYALECRNQNRRIFLLDNPWNQSLDLPQGVYRVHGWGEIIEAI